MNDARVNDPRVPATAAQIREHYDSLAFIYQTFWGDHIHHGLFDSGSERPHEAQLRMLDFCATLAGFDRDLPRGARVLDVGCGHGGTAIYLAQKFQARVTGITLSEKQAAIARQSAKKHKTDSLTDFIVADVESYTLPTAEFDLIWHMESSEHFQDKTSHFARAASALTPDGKLFVAAWTGSMEHSDVRAVADAFLCPALWTPSQYESAFAAAGLATIAREDLTPKVIRTWELAAEQARAAGPMLKLMPRAVQDFVAGIDVILHAYRSGALTYTVLLAQRS